MAYGLTALFRLDWVTDTVEHWTLLVQHTVDHEVRVTRELATGWSQAEVEEIWAEWCQGPSCCDICETPSLEGRLYRYTRGTFLCRHCLADVVGVSLA
jgi:hypothetical protein